MITGHLTGMGAEIEMMRMGVGKRIGMGMKMGLRIMRTGMKTGMRMGVRLRMGMGQSCIPPKREAQQGGKRS